MNENEVDTEDYARARLLIQLLPGFSGAYAWTLSEETWPGRYLHMISLKTLVMSVSSIPHGNQLI